MQKLSYSCLSSQPLFQTAGHMRWIFCHSSSHASSISCIFSQEPNPKLMALLKKKNKKKKNREKGKEVRRLTPFKLSCNRKLSLCCWIYSS